MRTTLTLEQDVERQLRALCEKRRQPFKQVVNEALRLGLAHLLDQRPAPRRKYRVKPVSLGRPRLPSLDDIASVLAVAEGEERG